MQHILHSYVCGINLRVLLLCQIYFLPKICVQEFDRNVFVVRKVNMTEEESF